MENFELIDLCEEYDVSLLTVFYNTLMKKAFPMDDELEPLEKWIDSIRPRGPHEPPKDTIKPEMHICVLIDKKKMAKVGQQKSIAGGMVYEYYKMSNSGLLNYFVVDETYRGFSLGPHLVRQAYERCAKVAEQFLSQDKAKLADFRSRVILRSITESMEKNSTAAADFSLQFLAMLLPYLFTHDTNHKRFFTFFAETNAASVADGVLESAHRHKILHKIGFKLLDFDYIQPPLSDGQQPCADLLLLVLDTPDLPNNKHQKKAIPAITLMLFMLDFAYSFSRSVRSFVEEPYFQHVLRDLRFRGEALELYDLPWTRRTKFEAPVTVSKL